MISSQALTANYLAVNTEQGRHVWDGLKLKMPLFGPINRKLAVAASQEPWGPFSRAVWPRCSPRWIL